MKSLQGTICISRFNIDTYKIYTSNKNEITNNLIYSSPTKINKKILEYEDDVFVIDLLIDIEEIKSISILCKTHELYDSAQIYKNSNYSKYDGYNYFQEKLIKPENFNELERKKIKLIENILCKGKSHSKRGKYISEISEKILNRINFSIYTFFKELFQKYYNDKFNILLYEKVVSTKCINSYCMEIKKINEYCRYCFVNLFPDDKLSINYKTKEKIVCKYIISQFKQFDIICDKKIIDSCSLRRPDILIDFGNYLIIIEVDENQHKKYNTTCEDIRLNEIYESCNFRPIILIRFNPDSYICKEKKIFSPFIKNKNGYLEIADKQEWESRLKILKKEIQNQIKNFENDSVFTIKIIKLFYDEYP